MAAQAPITRLRLRRALLLAGTAALLVLAPEASATQATITVPLRGSGDLDCAGSLHAAELDGVPGDELVTSCPRDRAADGRATPINVFRFDASTRRFALLDTARTPQGAVACPWTTAADLDGNGHEDLVLGCAAPEAAGRGVFVLLRHAGGASFDAPVQLEGSEGPAAAPASCMAVSAVDVDLDGRPDVMATCAGSLMAWRHQGPTGFGTGIRLSLPPDVADAACMSIVTGDFDGAGAADVAVGCSATATKPQRFVLLLRDATGRVSGTSSFSAQAGEWCGHGLDAGNVDGDARDELLLACSGPRRAYGVVARVEAGGALDVSYVGSTGPYTVVLPFAQARCTSMNVAALRRFGRAARSMALGCPGLVPGGAALVHDAGTSPKVPVDLVRGSGAESCGRRLAAGDFDADGRTDLALSCGREEGPGVGFDDLHRGAVVALGRAAGTGSRHEDLLVGGTGPDRLDGGSGSDLVRGLGGPDRLRGGPGEDVIEGGAGADAIDARDGAVDRVDCGAGRDRAIVDRRDRVRGCELVTRR